MARLLGLLRASLGRPHDGRSVPKAHLSAVYGLSALSGPFAAAPAVARSYASRNETASRSHGAAQPAAARAASAGASAARRVRGGVVTAATQAGVRGVRVYRDMSHIVMVGSIADICRKLDQAVEEQFCQIAD